MHCLQRWSRGPRNAQRTPPPPPMIRVTKPAAVVPCAFENDERLFKRMPWLSWVFSMVFGWIYFGLLRLLCIPPILAQFGPKDPTHVALSYRIGGMLLGLMQDSLWVVVTLVVLSSMDDVVDELFDRNIQAVFHLPKRRRPLLRFKKLVRFVVYFVAFVAMAFASTADEVLLRTRWIRFTYDALVMYFALKGAADQMVVSKQEYGILYATVAMMVAFAVVFGLASMKHVKLNRFSIVPMVSLCVEQVEPEVESLDHFARRFSTRYNIRVMGIWIALGWYAIVIAVTQDLAVRANPLVSMIGLNTGLSEFFRLTHLCAFSTDSGSMNSAVNLTLEYHLETFLDNTTEDFVRFGEHTVYRKTYGFRGPKALNVSVDPSRLPNVLILMVESFRRRDSLYLSTGGDPTSTSATSSRVSLTPNFDQWAKRNIGFRNFWSSWRTSRSIESTLFGQVAYDDVWSTGTTNGRRTLKLSGLPQFMKARGYETIFTTGSRESYDNWDAFLPAHGFDQVLGLEEFTTMAKEDLGINLDVGKRTMSFWGLHDDVSFQVLQKVLETKQSAQLNATENGDQRTPWFITHYTISSHSPFEERPDWYASYPGLPDCAALYQHFPLRAKEIKNECEMRYFTDMALGRFLDSLNSSGILNDTIIVISGDHGQSPECGLSRPELCHVDVTRVAGALIAEGRLGEYAGTLLEDATHQNDVLPTLMDLIGVPHEGFVQSGVGRSLLRQRKPGTRVVFANIPGTQLASIQGNYHIEYRTLWNDIQVYDTETDPDQIHDLYDIQTAQDTNRKVELERIRDASRQINAYFKYRIDHECILQAEC